MNEERTISDPTLEDMQHAQAVPSPMRPAITDREMWIAIRSGVLGIVSAIETFGHGSPLAMATRAGLLVIADAIARRWQIKSRKSN